MLKLNEELKEKIAKILSDNKFSVQNTADNDAYDRFLSLYPSSQLESLTLDDYCLGLNSKKENFCWWLERGLEKVLGRYSPGTSRGHLIYKDKQGGFYTNSRLSDLSTEDALKYILKVHSVIANADVSKDISWIDDDAEIYKRAGVEPRCTMGHSRKLRLLGAYNPGVILPVCSTDHIKSFLLKLGASKEDIPASHKIVARMNLLTEYYRYFKENYRKDLTPFSFVRLLYSDELGIRPSTQKPGLSKSDANSEEEVLHPQTENLNSILYGPPGTGKTYKTTEAAVELAEPEWFYDLVEQELDEDEHREQLKKKYDSLVEEQRIAFTTFHQSFSYEDFVEGIRASTSEDGSGVQYEVEDGVFKTISDLAKASLSSGASKGIDIAGRKIWKMSLGNTLKSEEDIYQDCIERGLARLGYGWDVDFSGCSNKKDIIERYKKVRGVEFTTTSYEVTSVNTFINKITNGDLIIVSDGNSKFRAIGEVTGEYEILDDDDIQSFYQARRVNWLRTFEPSITSSVLFKRSLSQMTLYEAKPHKVNLDKLAEYLSEGNETSAPKNHVIVIDEINRGNISRIFGELITLLEKDKRIGGSDERSVILPYSKKPFSVPSNLYVLGTMNTADKSLAQLDLALRRRFEFKEMLPDPELLRDINVYGVNIAELLTIMNQRIEVLLDRDHLIGHSYFWLLKDLNSKEERETELGTIFQNKIIPLLQEYFFADWERIGWVLNDIDKTDKAERFIHLSEDLEKLSNIFSDKVVSDVSDRRYRINPKAFSNPRAYQGIIKKLDKVEKEEA